MTLTLARQQAPGLLGGVKFQLRAQVKLSKREAELVRRYGAARDILLQRQVKIPFTNTLIPLDIRIDGLIKGQVFKCKDIADILEYERNVKDACQTFSNYLQVMSAFGGEEVIRFTGLDAAEGDEEIETSVDDRLFSTVDDDGAARVDDDGPATVEDDGAGTVEDDSEAVSFQSNAIDADSGTGDEAADESDDFCYHCGAGVHANSTACATCHKAL